MTERSAYPSEEEVHEARVEQLVLSLHGPLPGRVQRYDHVHQVADVVPQVRNPHPQPDGSYVFEDLPVLPDVPIQFPRVGSWFVAMSVEPGDAVLIVPGGVAPGRWRRATTTDALAGIDRAVQGVTNPNDMARFHLQNAYAIPCGETYGKALRHAPPAYNGVDACLRLGHDADGGLRFSLFADGRVKLTKGDAVLLDVNSDGDIAIAGALDVAKALGIAELIDARLNTLRTAINTHTHPASSGTTSATVDGQVASLASVAATKVKGV